MKSKQLLIILIILLPHFVVAQNPLLHPDRLWSMVETHCLPAGNTYTSHYLKTGNDTLIDGEVYKILRYSQDETQVDWIDYGGYIRETADGKVYYTRSGLEEGLLYDFSASLGDTVVVLNQELIPDPLYMVVIFEDSVLLGDGWHRMMVLEDDNFPGQETWIEGVGSVSGLVKSGLNAFGSACGDFDLLCTTDAGHEIFMNPEYPTCWYVSTRIDNIEQEEELIFYPNPAQNILHAEGNFLNPGESYTARFIDFTGRLIMEVSQQTFEIDISQLKSGMYFVQIQTPTKNYSGKILKF